MTLVQALPSLAGLSHIGCVRSRNEDSLFHAMSATGSGQWLAVVADGMGGHAGGAVASQIAVETFRECWEGISEGDFPDGAWLEAVAHEANARIAVRAAADPGLKNMGTTLVAALVSDGKLTVAHVGDSRAYLLSKAGIAQLTRDHSVAQELIDNGSLTKEQAERSPVRHYLTRSLGIEAVVTVDSASHSLSAGDCVLLCSDGLSNTVKQDEMAALHASSSDPAELCQRLLDCALSRGAPDNVSVIACMV